MSLSDAQVRQFRERGYVLVPDLFRDEVPVIRSEVERLRRAGKLRNVATDNDGQTRSQTRENLQLCPMYSHSRLFRALPFAPKVIETVESLIGSPIMLHLDQVFLKPPKSGMGTSWHQDNAYFKIRDPLRGTAMWIAVHDATVENGTMQLVPGVQHMAFEHSRDPMSDHHIRCYPPLEETVDCILPAGGVAFFCYGTPHCTRDNRADHARAGVAYHFLHTDYAHDDLVAPDRHYRPYLTGPQATGGEREYGEVVAGTWEQELVAATP